jgi:glycosyltransferase involved in cell wall biosynthesis
VSDVYLPRVGGIEMNVSDLAAQQRAAGHYVEVVTLSKPSSADPSGQPEPGWGPATTDASEARERGWGPATTDASEARERGWGPATSGEAADIPVHRPAGTSVWAKAAAMWRYRNLGARAGFDIVHCHSSTFSPLTFCTIGASRGSNARVGTVMTVHSLWRYYTPLYSICDVALRWSRWPVVWSAVSATAADAVARAAVRPLDVHVLPNGIDLSAWNVQPWQAAAGTVRLASVMRLAARKRPMPLLRMLRDLRRRMPDDVALSAVIIGDGPARDKMQEFLDANDMGWVELAGRLPRDEVARRLAAADLYVAPSRLESFGIAALEARAIGLPVVGRDRTGLAEFIVDGRDGALCADDREMVQALQRIATKPGDYRRRQDDAHLTRLDWPAVVAQTERLYDLALAGRVHSREPAGAVTAR